MDIKLLIRKAIQFDQKASNFLAELCLNNCFSYKTETAIVQLFVNLALDGNIYFSHLSGLLIHNNKSIIHGHESAFWWFKPAADSGLACSQYFIGKILLSTRCKNNDLYEPAFWFVLAGLGADTKAKYEFYKIKKYMSLEQKILLFDALQSPPPNELIRPTLNMISLSNIDSDEYISRKNVLPDREMVFIAHSPYSRDFEELFSSRVSTQKAVHLINNFLISNEVFSSNSFIASNDNNEPKILWLGDIPF